MLNPSATNEQTANAGALAAKYVSWANMMVRNPAIAARFRAAHNQDILDAEHRLGLRLHDVLAEQLAKASVKPDDHEHCSSCNIYVVPVTAFHANGITNQCPTCQHALGEPKVTW